MLTALSIFLGVVFGCPYWLIALAMICDTALLIAGVEKF